MICFCPVCYRSLLLFGSVSDLLLSRTLPEFGFVSGRRFSDAIRLISRSPFRGRICVARTLLCAKWSTARRSPRASHSRSSSRHRPRGHRRRDPRHARFSHTGVEAPSPVRWSEAPHHDCVRLHRLSSPRNRTFPRNSLSARQIYFPPNCHFHPIEVAILKLGARDGNDSA